MDDLHFVTRVKPWTTKKKGSWWEPGSSHTSEDRETSLQAVKPTHLFDAFLAPVQKRDESLKLVLAARAAVRRNRPGTAAGPVNYERCPHHSQRAAGRCTYNWTLPISPESPPLLASCACLSARHRASHAISNSDIEHRATICYFQQALFTFQGGPVPLILFHDYRSNSVYLLRLVFKIITQAAAMLTQETNLSFKNKTTVCLLKRI